MLILSNKLTILIKILSEGEGINQCKNVGIDEGKIECEFPF